MLTRHKGRVKKLEEPTPSVPSPMFEATLAERRLRVRSMLPIDLGYEPFESTQSMKQFLGDLTVWVLAAKIHHRAASACRGLLRTWIEVDLHEKVPELEKRIEQLEAKAVKEH